MLTMLRVGIVGPSWYVGEIGCVCGRLLPDVTSDREHRWVDVDA